MTIEAAEGIKAGDVMVQEIKVNDAPMHEAKPAYICRLPSCNKIFTDDEKKQVNQMFCCPDHQAAFWTLARRLGKVMMDELHKERI